MSLNAMANPAARDPGPLVTLLPWRTVANVLPNGVRGPQVDPVLGGEVVERQQLVDVVGDLPDGFAELRPVRRRERGHRVQGVPAVLGVPDLGQRLLRPRVRRLR